MNYEFRCVGKTLQFDETYLDVVNAHPQTRHVVLHDRDNDGIYTGSITTRYDYGDIRMRDIIDYTVTVDENCRVTDFFYVEYAYVHKNDVENI